MSIVDVNLVSQDGYIKMPIKKTGSKERVKFISNCELKKGFQNHFEVPYNILLNGHFMF